MNWLSYVRVITINQKGGMLIMANKWLLRFGSSILALTLITGCGTADDTDVNDEAPLNQEDDNNNENMMENEDNGGNGGNGNNGNGGGNGDGTGGNGGGTGGNGGQQ